MGGGGQVAYICVRCGEKAGFGCLASWRLNMEWSEGGEGRRGYCWGRNKKGSWVEAIPRLLGSLLVEMCREGREEKERMQWGECSRCSHMLYANFVRPDG